MTGSPQCTPSTPSTNAMLFVLLQDRYILSFSPTRITVTSKVSPQSSFNIGLFL